MKSDIPYYDDYLSSAFKAHLLEEAIPVAGVTDLLEVGNGGGLETKEALSFLCELYVAVKPELAKVLDQRIRDRKFIDERTKASVDFNRDLKRDYSEADYKTVLGLEDGDGRIVWGPKSDKFAQGGGKTIAAIPEFLQGNHVTLFGPPDHPKLCINAMNAYHRKLKEEPAIVEELLSMDKMVPMWGADDEDSKTPLRSDLVSAGENLTKCLDGTIRLEDYKLATEKLSLPIKRFPGLALPCFFLFYQKNPLPLHLYDFALHFYRNWENKKALAFYVPKLENEEEARYIRIMLQTAEKMMKKIHPTYEMGTIRLMIVLENPRAIFRTHEIMDELHPYFVGASLGWHDYLASTARLFKEDANYRIPVKADPDIVIKYIKASHDLLSQVVGSRGGVKVGGMYGILPITNELFSPSFQVTMKGYIRDVVTQFKRDLTGFWVAHPDFVRLGMALVAAWKIHKNGDSSKLDKLVTSLLDKKYHQEILDFIHGPDILGLDVKDPMYARSLIVANLQKSNTIANNHPDEVRYNIFQSLQYLTDWLAGNGCVSLPAQVSGVAVRVMDDLATAERSRWEVWHEIHHGRFALTDFLKIAHEELHFIRKDKSNDKKIVQVKWDERTEKWYPVAMKLMTKLMTDKEPVEFATQLLLPFTADSLRNAKDPWADASKIDPVKFAIPESIQRFNYYFEMCGSLFFARSMSKNLIVSLSEAEHTIMNFGFKDILEAASFHGDIGESKKTLDKMASGEQAEVLKAEESIKAELFDWGQKYLDTFGMKFLISAQGKSAPEILSALKERIKYSKDIEIKNAQLALWQITQKRLLAHPFNHLGEKVESIFKKHQINAAQLAISTGDGLQILTLGKATPQTWFEMASLSKTVATAFAMEYFKQKGIALSSSVNELLSQTSSTFRLKDGDKVTVAHLMSHSSLNLHYVNGVPANKAMPKVRDLLEGNAEYLYEPVKVINPPGEVFKYSGGGFLVLEHLIEALAGKSIFELTRPFLNQLGMHDFSFDQHTLNYVDYAHGYNDQGLEVEGTRKMFPATAAGSMGTSAAMQTFLVHLENAYHDLAGSGPLSHDTARLMLQGSDKGCKKFMGTNMGLGVFIGEAGLNRFAIHQGANDGFRCLYVHCYFGPDQGKGFTLLCNSELKGVLFNAEVAQALLKELKMQGIDFSYFKSDFDSKKISQEEVVNIGYKKLVFDAFIPTRPEPIIDRGPKDPLAIYNIMVDAKVLDVSDERFARAENLFSDHLPKFDPELFGKQGKVMDSWESVRHNPKDHDYLIVELKKPASLRYVLLSTKYHFGNHSPMIRLEGLANGQWQEFLPKTGIEGHSERRIKLDKETATFTQIRISMYPDGGFSRLGLFGEDLPDEAKKKFDGINHVYEEQIPQTKKPLSIKYTATDEEIKKNWSKISRGEEFNNVSVALGATIISATNEHYSPAALVISPYGPINMFDGMESSRSRTPGHFDEVVISLAVSAKIHRIEMNFTYFVNNNPLFVEVCGLSKGQWQLLVEKTNAKAFSGNKRDFEIKSQVVFEKIMVRTFPDGGMNRLKVFSTKEV